MYFKNDKVGYLPIVGHGVLGEVVDRGSDKFGDFVVWRVTSRTHLSYKCGEIVRTSAASKWLTLR